jgi:hypothetical protein
VHVVLCDELGGFGLTPHKWLRHVNWGGLKILLGVDPNPSVIAILQGSSDEYTSLVTVF